MSTTNTTKQEVDLERAFSLEDFFETSPDFMCIAGFDGYFKSINPAVSQLLGYSEEELFSRPINDFIFEADQDKTASARINLTKKVGLFNFENRYISKSGTIIWLHWTSHPVEFKQVIYAIGKNVTAKKEVELERKKHLKMLTQSNTDLLKLAYANAHDLRSPINNLLSVFDLIDTTKITDGETLELLEIVEQSTQNLKKTITEAMKSLDKKNANDKQLELLNFESSAEDVITSIHSLVHHSQAKISTDFTDLPTIKFNKAALHSIFLNLITNAIKYAKRNVAPEIHIKTQEIDGVKQLIIQDNGIGFDMSVVKDKIFGLHQTFNSYEDSTGIGLYLVYNHVMHLGGKIGLESEVDQGAKFMISFKS
ncbi:PAS domain-containing sensor histidine kinase [Flavobacterium sp. TMP13]|uniref:PAS domain-containing sensor histidine kinase n=1 Tax=Flavobacterium sp. TMP13 TaxID=3425950 RepID=UPI003D78A31C